MKNYLNPKEIKKIAVFRTDRIGETLLSMPVVLALKKAFPLAKILFIASYYSRDIVEARPDIDDVLYFDTLGQKVPFWRALGLSAELRKARPDLAVVLNPHRVLHAAVFLAGISHRLGFNRKWSFLLNHKIEDTRSEGRMHEVDYNLNLLEAIGIHEKNIAPFMYTDQRDANYVKGIFAQFGILPDRKTIVLHPGTSNPQKQWPVQNYAELAKKISASGNFNIILTGAGDEKALCDEIKNKLQGAAIFNLAGSMSIRQIAAFFKEVQLMITNDNGPMHVAAAMGVRIVALFGRKDPGTGPKRWGPYGKGHIIIHKCPITSISVDEVFSAAKSILT